MTNLYDNNLYFALQHLNTRTLILEPKSNIIEPMNWDKIINHILRDKKYYGYWSDFLEDSYGLTFSFIKAENGLTGGGELLKNIYETLGDQEIVYFSIGYSNQKGIPYQQIKSWRVVLQEYELIDGSNTNDFGGVQLSIEKMPFQGKLKSRFNTPVSINQYTTIDGELLSPISSYTLRLHSKTLQEVTISSTPTPTTSPDSVGTFFDTYLILQPDQLNITTNELNQVFSQPIGFLNTTSRNPAASGTPAPANGAGLDLAPFDTNLSQYNPTTSGILNIEWYGGGPNTSFYWWRNLLLDFWTITPRVIVQRLVKSVWTIVGEYDGTTYVLSDNRSSNPAPTGGLIPHFPSATNLNLSSTQYILPDVAGSTNRSNCSQVSNFTFYENFTNIQVKAGDCVYVHFILCPSATVKAHTTGYIQVDQFFNTIKYSQLTSTPSTTCQAYRAIDILNQQLECITGNRKSVISSFLSKGGAGYNFLYTNGYSIRNFNANIHLPKKSINSLINDLCVHHCLAVGIQEFNGNEYLRIEYILDFFKPRVIASFLQPLNYIESHNQDICYNEFKFGYNKYQGLNLLMQDEFNTQGDYISQYITFGANKMEMLSDTVVSGYIIEDQRRNQFNINPSQSLQEDETFFGIATNEPFTFYQLGTQWGNATSIVIFSSSSMSLLPGDTFSYTIQTWQSSDFYRFGAVVIDPLTSTNYVCLNLSENFTSSLNPSTDPTNWSSGGGLNAGTVFTIVQQSDNYPQIGLDGYFITPAPVSEIFVSCNIIINPPSPDQIFAERDNCFKVCTGVVDSSTIYNGRLSLKHILYAWRPIISIGLYFAEKNISLRIITSMVKMNSKFTTQFLPSEEFKGNVGNLIINEYNNEFIDIYQSSSSTPFLYSPIKGEVTFNAGWDEVEILRKALCGETNNVNFDFGGVVLLDSKGEIWFHHVTDMRYDPFKQWLTLTTQKLYIVANSIASYPKIPTIFTSQSGMPFISEDGSVIFIKDN